MTENGSPAADIDITETLVKSLLREQHGDLEDLPLRFVDAGWDNVTWRLGEDLALRIPRRALAAQLIENEQKWLPKLAGHLPLPVPVPTRVGAAGCGYPWSWSVLPWLGGVAADLEEPDGRQGGALGGFLTALHIAAPDDAPENVVRGVPLSSRAAGVEERMQRLAAQTSFITPRILQLWHEALEAPIDVAATWLHGDFHARNVLVERGAISAVIDWGDITSGDRATDLASLWMLLADVRARDEAIEVCGKVSGATWSRAKGWAILFAVFLTDTGRVDNPRHALMGERIFSRLSAR